MPDCILCEEAHFSLPNLKLSQSFCTVDRIKEPMFIRTLGLQFHLLKPQSKNSKEAETGNDSYIVGFILFGVKLQGLFV